MSKKTLAVLVLMSMFCLSGCWNYREINEVNIVAGVAVDYIARTDTYFVTAEIIQPQFKGGEAQMTPVVIGMEGRTLFEGIRNLILRSGKKLYWSHAKVLILSEEVAQRGIMDILDWVTRDREIRPDISILISRNKTAKEILLSDALFETTVSYQINNTLEQEEHVSKLLNLSLWELLQSLARVGNSSLISTVNTIEFDGKTVPQVYGSAIIVMDQMIGWLNGDEVKALAWATRPGLNTLLITVQEEQNARITYEFLNNSPKIKPFRMKDGTLALRVYLKGKVQLTELNVPVDFMNNDMLKIMKKNLDQYMKNSIENVLHTLQRKYHADVAGFSVYIKRNMPDEWKKIEKDWDAIYPNLPLEVQVDMDIIETELLKTPVHVRQ